MVQNLESPGLFGRVDSTVIVTFAMTLKMDGKFSQNNELISIRRGKIFAQPHTFIMHSFFDLIHMWVMWNSGCEIAACRRDLWICTEILLWKILALFLKSEATILLSCWICYSWPSPSWWKSTAVHYSTDGKWYVIVQGPKMQPANCQCDWQFSVATRISRLVASRWLTFCNLSTCFEWCSRNFVITKKILCFDFQKILTPCLAKVFYLHRK